MSKIILTVTILASFFSNPAQLKVIVKNIQVGKGSVVVDVYDNAANFSKRKPLASNTLNANNETLEFSFDISEGEYALKIYQDINENKKCDAGLFNIPKEPYGLSNNFRPSFSAPTWDNCKFKVTEQTTQTITIK